MRLAKRTLLQEPTISGTGVLSVIYNPENWHSQLYALVPYLGDPDGEGIFVLMIN